MLLSLQKQKEVFDEIYSSVPTFSYIFIFLSLHHQDNILFSEFFFCRCFFFVCWLDAVFVGSTLYALSFA